MKNIIEVKDLTKVYKDGSEKIVALDEVSFSLPQGQDLAIVGPSGSGKTTLLELIAGLNKPTSGQVIIDSRDVNKGSDTDISQFRNKTIGFVFQLMHLQDYFTALENVTLPLIACGTPRKEALERAQTLLERVGLKHRLNQYPKQLSGGEMQRVAIARSLANKPKIIMADEPTGKLDKKNADNVMQIFAEVAKDEGVSFVLITHDESISKKYRNIIRLDHGKMAK